MMYVLSILCPVIWCHVLKEYIYSFINSKFNTSDILSKHWSHKDVWPMLRAILLWRGDMMDLARYQEDNNDVAVGGGNDLDVGE